MRRLLLSLIVAVAFTTGSNAFATAEHYIFQQEPSGNLDRYFLKRHWPNYPDVAAAMHKKGEGWFRLKIDRPTGAVTEVKILKSTGVKILDDSAAVAFMQWRAKPNILDHAVIKVQFLGAREETGSHIKW
jgi:TonB family protein